MIPSPSPSNGHPHHEPVPVGPDALAGLMDALALLMAAAEAGGFEVIPLAQPLTVGVMRALGYHAGAAEIAALPPDEWLRGCLVDGFVSRWEA